MVICSRALDLRGLYFCADGSVSICCMDFNRKLIIGDMKNNSLLEIINSENVNAIQKAHIDGSILKSNFICKNCDQIRDRKDALVYTSDNSLQVGKPSLRKY
ncbi:hypothetical protein FACS189461_5830 [Spirochaetia bacterium]|nr:hypothetical protein FACS189461_5830 [Spirochaetia bacterium]